VNTRQQKIKRAGQAYEAAIRQAEIANKERGDCSIGNRIEEMRWQVGYAEPGYAGGPVVTGNWNNVDTYDRATQKRVTISLLPSRLAKLFEACGVHIEWGDEWASCDDCGRIVRNQPDSYDWAPSYTESGDGKIYCRDCAPEDEEDEEDAIDRPVKA
jgi:hypothetical protein